MKAARPTNKSPAKIGEQNREGWPKDRRLPIRHRHNALPPHDLRKSNRAAAFSS